MLEEGSLIGSVTGTGWWSSFATLSFKRSEPISTGRPELESRSGKGRNDHLALFEQNGRSPLNGARISRTLRDEACKGGPAAFSVGRVRTARRRGPSP